MDARIEYERLREEAKKCLNSLLKIPEGFSCGTAERLVDCIIDAAVLKTKIEFDK